LFLLVSVASIVFVGSVAGGADFGFLPCLFSWEPFFWRLPLASFLTRLVAFFDEAVQLLLHSAEAFFGLNVDEFLEARRVGCGVL
jgi:hypothetical protein